MRILVLDDDEQRHEIFAKRLRGNEVKHVFTSSQAIEALQNAFLAPFDLAYLDHDLGEKINDPYPREVTGDDVARWMVMELPIERRPKQIIIHSWNPDGARRMANRLYEAGFHVRREEFTGEK